MSVLIKTEIEKVKSFIELYKDLSDDRAFSYVLLKHYFNVSYADQDDYITDGNNDGGIDFAYFDDEESKLVVCQSKLTESLMYNDVIAELEKMHSTIENFIIGNTGSYNSRLKFVLQNLLDRLPDDNADNIEYQLFTSCDMDTEAAMKKINKMVHSFSVDAISLFAMRDIENKILENQQTLNTVKEDKIAIDKANNYLSYESNDCEGIMVNISSRSVVNLYNKYSKSGLFDLNIRRYISNKLVDTGIKETLDNDRDNFWFLNNGIIIACEDFDIDGNTVKLYQFSIVNGGQTTNRIAEYKGDNSQEFFIPCKIIAEKKSDPNLSFYTKIAEATNSQKPILPRDLKSNTPEMLRLHHWLADEKIYFEIKRGTKPKFIPDYKIKNDEFGQMLLSFILQRPGTARSGKKTIFENKELYNRLYKQNYNLDSKKKDFIKDCIYLFSKYQLIESDLKKNSDLSASQAEILKNGQQIIFALFGVVYRLVNDDIKETDLTKDLQIVKTTDFVYSSFISNYPNDDLDERLRQLIYDIVSIVSDSYEGAYAKGLTTSVSNYFKTDSKYVDHVLKDFVTSLKLNIGKDLKEQMVIFCRN